MARYSNRRYNVQVLALMAVYFGIMFWLWPYALHASNVAPKIFFALMPLVPVTWVIWLMARRVMASDELEQRLHLIALGMATGLVGAASLVGGFLAAAKVWITDGGVLIMVFPAMCFVYGIARFSLKRRITGSWDLWGC